MGTQWRRVQYGDTVVKGTVWGYNGEGTVWGCKVKGTVWDYSGEGYSMGIQW